MATSRPVAGVQEYDVAPLTLIVVDVPKQTAVGPPVTVTVGSEFTVIALVAVLLQPAAFVPVMV